MSLLCRCCAMSGACSGLTTRRLRPPPSPAANSRRSRPGVAPFTVVAEDVTGPSDGQKVILRVALGQPIKRDDIYPVLHTLYRHAMKRGPFEPIQFSRRRLPQRGDGQGRRRRADCWPASSREQSQLAPQL